MLQTLHLFLAIKRGDLTSYLTMWSQDLEVCMFVSNATLQITQKLCRCFLL